MNSDSTRPPLLLVLYQQYLDHQDSARFLQSVSERYATGSLERLVKHPNRWVRRAAVAALGMVGQYDANHTLGCAMLDDDRTVRTLAESGIRNLWVRAGNTSEREELGAILRFNAAQLHREALARATLLVERAPWFAEAWYQRAVAYAAIGRLVESIRDCFQALEINPYHFVAAAHMGYSYLQLDNPVSALECFRRALALNPGLEGVRAQVARLKGLVDG